MAAAVTVVGVTAAMTSSSGVAHADNGHAELWAVVVGGASQTYGDPVVIAGSISDHSISCGLGDCDTPSGFVTVTFDGVPFSAATTPGLITPVADFSLTLPTPPAGQYQGFASFTGNFTVVVDETVSFTVAQRPCTTALTQSLSATPANGPFFLLAKVSSSTAPATGTVTFFQDDGTPALDIVLATANVDPATNRAGTGDLGALLPSGATNIYAVYSGDGNHVGACRSNTLTHTVATDPPPTANDDSVHTQRNTSVTFDVLGNDGDPGGGALFGPEVDGAGPEHGQLTGAGTALTYIPDDGYVGDDSFTYYVTDENGSQSGLASVSIEVTCDPVAVGDAYSTSFDTALVVADPNANLLTNDDTCERAVQLGRIPRHGTITGFDGSSGIFTYTPEPGYAGPDTFTYAYTRGIQVVAVGRVNVVVRPDPVAATTSTTSTSSTTSTTTGPAATPTSPSGSTTAPTAETVASTATSSTSSTAVANQPAAGVTTTTDAGSAALPGGAPATVFPTTPGGGVLPTTGADIDRVLLVAAAVIGFGLVMLRLRRTSGGGRGERGASPSSR